MVLETFTLADLPEFFLRFTLLSLLSVGGAISTAPEMHRYLVEQKNWMGDDQFTASIALAQAAPGPNLLFVPILGYQAAGALGAAAAFIGILLPSSIVTLSASRWGHRRRDTPGVRAFVHGLAPITICLLLSAGWIVAQPFLRNPDHRLGAVALIAVTITLMLSTRIMPIWLIAMGAIVGALGWI